MSDLGLPDNRKFKSDFNKICSKEIICILERLVFKVCTYKLQCGIIMLKLYTDILFFTSRKRVE
jgi:hypothetical protein